MCISTGNYYTNENFQFSYVQPLVQFKIEINNSKFTTKTKTLSLLGLSDNVHYSSCMKINWLSG